MAYNTAEAPVFSEPEVGLEKRRLLACVQDAKDARTRRCAKEREESGKKTETGEVGECEAGV